MWHQQAAAEQDDRDGAKALQHIEPGHVRRQHVLGQQRQQCDGRNERHVLEQQDGERVAAGGAAHQVAFREHRQHDGGGGERQTEAEHQAAGPGNAGRMVGQQQQAAQHHRARHQLAQPQAENRFAQYPEAMRPQFQADQEQQHYDAERRDIGDLVHAGHQAEPARPDHHAGHQVADDAAEPEAAGQRDGNHCRGQQGHQGCEHKTPFRRACGACRPAYAVTPGWGQRRAGRACGQLPLEAG